MKQGKWRVKLRSRENRCDNVGCWCRLSHPDMHKDSGASRYTPDYPPPRFGRKIRTVPPWLRVPPQYTDSWP